MNIHIPDLKHLDKAAAEFVRHMGKQKIFAFYGEMGAGKTSFIKALCRAMNVEDSVSSPSFALIYEYHSRDFGQIFHFDLYRIKNELELYDLGYEDYFYGDSICFIEWPELAGNLLPPGTARYKITVNENKSRDLLRF